MTNFLDMADLSSQQQMMVNQTVQDNKKDKTIMIILWLFFAGLGAHRFYLGNTGYAICMILFGWMTLLIWPLIDIIFALKELERKNNKVRQDAINEMRIMNGGHKHYMKESEVQPSE